MATEEELEERSVSERRDRAEAMMRKGNKPLMFSSFKLRDSKIENNLFDGESCSEASSDEIEEVR